MPRELIFKAAASLQVKLLQLPESGMGFQFVADAISSKNWLVLNSEVVIDINSGIVPSFEYKDASMFQEINFEPVFQLGRLSVPAIEAPIQKAKGTEADYWVRLSAFEQDRRIDGRTGRLLPGSFTTRFTDFTNMGLMIPGDTTPHLRIPHERYALPNNLPISWVFSIKAANGDEFQQGVALPAYSRSGGGVECFFANGTSEGTLHQKLRA